MSTSYSCHMPSTPQKLTLLYPERTPQGTRRLHKSSPLQYMSLLHLGYLRDILLRVFRIKTPNSARFFGLDLLPDWLRQLVKKRVVLLFDKEPPLPFNAFGRFLLAHVALLVFNKTLFVVCRVHISLSDSLDDRGPSALRLPDAEILGRRVLQGCFSTRLIEIVPRPRLLASFINSEVVAPLTFHRIQGLFFFAFFVERCGETILLSANPAFARIIDFRDVSS